MPGAAFGIFDHVDRSDEPIGALDAHRLELVEAAEAAGFTTRSNDWAQSSTGRSR